MVTRLHRVAVVVDVGLIGSGCGYSQEEFMPTTLMILVAAIVIVIGVGKRRRNQKTRERRAATAGTRTVCVFSIRNR
jgi:hypothetical protein